MSDTEIHCWFTRVRGQDLTALVVQLDQDGDPVGPPLIEEFGPFDTTLDVSTWLCRVLCKLWHRPLG